MDPSSGSPGLSGLVGPGRPFLRGLALGLAVAAPVGPMSVLCMRQTLARGFLAGSASGLGVATADGVYGAIAALGLAAVTDLLVGHQPWLRAVGEDATPLLLVAGVCLGSALWWLTITGTVSLARTRLSERLQRAINVAAGLALVAFGLVALASMLAP